VSAHPKLAVRAAALKVLILEEHTSVFLNRPYRFLSLLLAESPSAQSRWACREGVEILTAAPGLCPRFYFVFASAHRAEAASGCVPVRCLQH